MVQHRNTFFRQSLDLAHKGFVTCGALVFAVACSSGTPKSQVHHEASGNEAPSLQAAQTTAGLRLTSIGFNKKARFSPDDKTLIFLSGERRSHKQFQVYELSLETFREKRITFHDGDSLDVDYSPTGSHLIYASTTDELKERPPLIKPQVGKLAPAEIYLADRKGGQIERLTQTPGYQSEVSWVGQNQVLFVSEVDASGRTRIERLILQGATTSEWGDSAEYSLRIPTVDDSATRVAWVAVKGSEKPLLGLKLRGQIIALETPFVEIQSLQWILRPDKTPILLASAKKKNDAYLSAWILDPEKKCLSQFFEESGGSLRDLQVSHRQDRLVMTFETRGSSQLFLREFPKKLPENCETLKHGKLPMTAAKPPAPPKAEPAKKEITEPALQTSESAGSAADPKEDPKTP